MVILGIIAQMFEHARSHSERQRAAQELRRAILEGRLEVSIRAEPDASDAAPGTGIRNDRGSDGST